MSNLIDTVLGLHGVPIGNNPNDITARRMVRELYACLPFTFAAYDAPPAQPKDGEKCIVPPKATGAWYGHDTAVALYDGANKRWRFYPPKTGQLAIVGEEIKRFDGGNWVRAVVSGDIDSGQVIGLVQAQLGDILPLSLKTTAEAGKGAGHE